MRRPVDVKAHFRLSSFRESVPIQPSRPCRHPSIRTLCERSSLGARWVFSFSRCCYLIIDLCSYLFVGVGPQDLVAVTWTRRSSSAVRLKLSRPQRASLFGYCAMVRTPLRSPTTDVAVPPTFAPPPLPLASWHFFLLARGQSKFVPIVCTGCKSCHGEGWSFTVATCIESKSEHDEEYSFLSPKSAPNHLSGKPCRFRRSMQHHLIR